MVYKKSNPVWLLDGNVLVSLALVTHVNHRRAVAWFDNLSDSFATCSVTQGTLLRLYMLSADDRSAKAAWGVLTHFTIQPDHVFWDDGFSYLEVSSKGLTGHKQVTDAWLATLARRRNGRVATLDEGFAALYPDVVSLVPQ